FLLFFNNKKLQIIGLYIALIAVTIPPFGLTCRTHPLASAGIWWSGGGWLALAAVLLLIPAFCRWPVLPAVPVLLALFLSYYPVATHWFDNPVVPLQGHLLAFFVCYEQFLFWPVLQSLWHKPDLLCATSNVWWAAGTNIPDIQHNIMAAWSQLFSVPLLTATNL
ncbi:MAG: hypothetical protein MUO63_16295, partial [Desulfobulbaceae bacterium]|nr:hypothetical protein [Desulfobulbaceae bacterium]